MKLYRQVILLTLTLLVLVSSTGMAVGLHICGGELRDITLFGAEADCPMDMHQPAEKFPACHTPVLDQKEDTCCKDHAFVVERLDATSKHDVISLTKLQDLQLLAIIKAVIFRFYTSETDLEPTYALYTSPPLARDIPVLVQSFLL
ncbi:HYC_CC_PP family protein [Pontibacter flavimaris]|uniref:Secreted protein n=1 Tax=Pontibacter flavimaris TaxID=1797110 RepID=A0A1Q5P939_9BACT|nr:hypothetical protein [Pontibacter flavimaris]OKL38755.1 hypothetical protein A3841_06360 [Pontibacter flavimaris]